MLKQLTLNNFKKHKALALSFPGGLTSITGNNAAGKSTVLKGILFALFGSAAIGAKDHIWSWGSKDKRSVALQMTLPVYGDVIISRTPSGATVTAVDDGRNLASGNAAGTQFIEASLGMLAKDLKTITYSPQGETQNILTMGPTALQQKVEGLSRVDILDRVLSHLSTDLTKIEGRLEGIPADFDITGLETRLQILSDKKRKTEQDIAVSVGIKDNLTDQRTLVERDTKTLQEHQHQHQLLSAELFREEQNVANLWQQVTVAMGNLNSLEGAGNPVDIEELKFEYSASKASYDEAARYMHKLNAEASERQQCRNDIERYTKLLEEHTAAEEELNTLQPVIAEKGSKHATLASEKSTVESDLRRVEEMLHNAKCPVCKRNFDGVNFDEISLEAQKLSVRWQTLNTEASALWVEYTALGNQEKNLKKSLNPGAAAYLDARRTRLAEIPEVSESAMAEALTHVEKLAMATNALVADINSTTATLARISEIEKQVKGLEAQLHAATLKVATVSDKLNAVPDTSAIPSLQEYITELDMRLSKCEQQIQDYRLEISRCDSEIGHTKTELFKLKQLEAERQELDKEQSHLQSFQKYLKGNRSKWAGDIWEGLLQYASALVSNTTSGELGNLARSSKGEFTVEELGRVVPVEESSGFQKSLIGTALRVALSKVFYGDNLFLLLDEATADANDENAAAVAGMLASLNMQVVMVSHRSGDSVNAGNLVELK
ncbi:AAA family ATPase [Methylovulum miyakonense]|uniref:AAA family ATPase n=1 Tax=Methylovulum miyakonense TaxID=645578 RepID=UPI000379FCF4|nr:AAA family ATPase [Methylovulum miyakonense]